MSFTNFGSLNAAEGNTVMDIAVIVCIALLAAALITISILLILFSRKKSDKTNEKHTIIIHQYVPVKAAEPVIIREKVTVYEPAEPEPAEEAIEEPAEVVEEPETVAETVEEPAKPEQTELAVAAEEPAESAMRYNRSFRARLIQSDDRVKEWYGTIKNHILAYGRVSSRLSWKHESFSYRRNAVAKLLIKGKTLYLYLALNAADYGKDSPDPDKQKFDLDDVSKVSQFADTPALYKLKSEKRVRYAQALIDDVCAGLGCELTDREPEDYYEPYHSDAALIKKWLVKRVIEDAEKSFIGASGYSAAQDTDSAEGKPDDE